MLRNTKEIQRNRHPRIIKSKSPDSGHFDRSVKRGIGLGVFDGYHRGHQELIRTLLANTLRMSMVSCIFTFSNHPALVSGNHEKIAMGLLTTEEEKIGLLSDTGVDEILCQEFSPEFAAMPANLFLENYLFEMMNAGLIVVGYNYRFGRNREGNVDFLKSWAKDKGIEVIVIEPVVFCGTSISSSTIRKSIAKGDFETANAMLGRDYRLTGIVMPGQRLGSKLGFPTANILPAAGKCLPENGVYVTRLHVGNRTYEAVTNIGLRPSVAGAVTTPIIETSIIDQTIDLYGKKIQVFFLHLMRKEKKFDDLDALKHQVQKDIRAAALWHAEAEQCWEMARVGQIPVYGIRSVRFTGNVASIVFKAPLSKETASRYALLARVLMASCRQFPSRPALSRYLDSLYGAGVDSNVETAGDIQILHFTADALHTWQGASYPFQKVVELLFDMLQFPHFDTDALFVRDIFESERSNLIHEILARENDKTKYALDHCIDLLTADTIQNIKATGDIDILKEISLEELTKAYHSMMEETDVSIFIAGHIDISLQDQICTSIARTFKENRNGFTLVPGKIPQWYVPAPKEASYHEVKAIEQSKICMVYKGIMPYFSNSTGAVAIFNSMLGGDVHSLLFDVVREQMGLAYSVFSMPLRYLSSILLVAGVAPDKVEIAFKAMKEQVERLAAGDFDDALFQSALESVSYSYRAVADDLHSMLFYYQNAMTGGRNVALQDALCFMKDFTKETMIEIAKKLEWSVSFTLTPSMTEKTEMEGIAE